MDDVSKIVFLFFFPSRLYNKPVTQAAIIYVLKDKIFRQNLKHCTMLRIDNNIK
jgi:hypothetical protein